MFSDSYLTRSPLRYTSFPYTTLFRSPRLLLPALSLHARVGRARRQEPDRARDSERGGLRRRLLPARGARCHRDRKSTRLNSSHANSSYAVFCLKKKKKRRNRKRNTQL